MVYHDFDKLKKINIIDVLKKLDVDVYKERKTLCFMHDDHQPSLYIYKNDNSWYCYTCGKGGGVIDLVKDYFNYDTDKACRWLEVEFNIAPKPQGWSWEKKKHLHQHVDSNDGKIKVDSDILEWIIAHTDVSTKARHFLEEERKIKKEVYEGLNIKSIDNVPKLINQMLSDIGEERLTKNHILSKGKYDYFLTWDAPCLLFPYYDIDGKLINIQSRYLNRIEGDYPPRFRFIKDSKTSIYNAQLLSNLNRFDPLLVTEGVTDCLAALSAGINAIAIPGAMAFKSEYVDLLKEYTLFICPDHDSAGNKLLLDMKEKMRTVYNVVRELKLDDYSKDIGEYYAKHECLRFG